MILMKFYWSFIGFMAWNGSETRLTRLDWVWLGFTVFFFMMYDCVFVDCRAILQVDLTFDRIGNDFNGILPDFDPVGTGIPAAISSVSLPFSRDLLTCVGRRKWEPDSKTNKKEKKRKEKNRNRRKKNEDNEKSRGRPTSSSFSSYCPTFFPISFRSLRFHSILVFFFLAQVQGKSTQLFDSRCGGGKECGVGGGPHLRYHGNVPDVSIRFNSMELDGTIDSTIFTNRNQGNETSCRTRNEETKRSN